MPDRETKLKAGKFPVDALLVRQLVAGQFPQWADLPVRAVAMDGWDNWTFHLGDRMKVRLPSAEWYNEQTAKENHWLPLLAPHLPVEVPVPLAVGLPTANFPWPWSIYQWIDGEPVTRSADNLALARGVAEFLGALQQIDPTGAPPSGPHNFLRGAHPIDAYGDDARRYIETLSGRIDTEGALAVLDSAAQSRQINPVWVHGDIAVGNLLMRDGLLSAVIDFGGAAVGDPSCDLALAWVFLDGESRVLFRSSVPVDEATWARARAWALWKAAFLLANDQIVHPDEHTPLDVIAAVIADNRNRP